ncbi:hypothetical protein [Paenibacillus agricola]|uniref:Uncharacterized protein n=1 Tax=Paenibacillus agricola TaxID=2716264 RepID=A0ABX0JIV5_9BACL|nr:hypothetical protein [Paenibacillus agricola]NHN34404.1 hypothetical protein [Paenibacillus agricola]
MNEIELYIELIDDKMCTKILKEFGETVPGFSRNPTIQQKKLFIKNMFKGQTTRNWKRASSSNRFFKHISAYKNASNDELFGKYDMKGLFRHLAEINGEQVPDHVKLAVALMYQPEILKEKLPLLVENFKENKSIFDIPVHFESEEELANHLREQATFMGATGIDNFLNMLQDIFTDEERSYLDELRPIVAEMTLLEFENTRREFQKELDFIAFFSFALTHIGEQQDIRIGMALHSAYYLAENRQKKWSQSIDQNHILGVEKLNWIQSMESRDTVQVQLQEAKEKLKVSEREKRQYDKEKKELNVAVSKLTASIQKLEKDYEKKMQVQLTQQEKAVEAQKRELLEVGEQLAASEQKINQIAEDSTCYEEIRSFAVVHHQDSEFFSLVFPEITVFSMSQFTQRNEKIKQFPKIYIQRDGLNSTVIYKVQDICQKNGIETEFFFARSNKELLEKTACFKQTHSGV